MGRRFHHGLVRHGLVRHGLVRHGLVRHGLVRHGLVRHGLVRHGLVRHGLVRHGLVRHGLGWGLGGAVLFALAAGAAAQDSAEALFRKGFRAQRDERHIDAYALYSQARALDPTNRKYIRAALQAREPAAQLIASTGDYRTAAAMAPTAAGLQRLAAEAEDGPAGARLAVSGGQPERKFPERKFPERKFPERKFPERKFKEPVRLQANNHAAAFRFRGTLGEAYRQVAGEFGLEAVFDEQFDHEEKVRIDLFDCDFSCAMLALGDVGRTLIVPVTEKRFLVTEDSEGKRRELEPVASVAIPLNDALTAEEVTQIGQAIQQSLDIRRFQMSPTAGMLFSRDTVTKVRMAQAMADALLRPRGAVMIEMSVVSVNRERTADLGIALPDSFPVTNFSTILNGIAPEFDGSAPLIGIGGGRTVLGVTVGGAQALATLNSGTGRSLQALSVRAEHGMPAEIKLGERFPIVTAQFSAAPSPGLDDAAAGNFIQPIPSFTFEDLGLTLKATPLVHSAKEVTLELETEFRLLAGGAVNGVPILSNRQFQSSVRLRAGEFAIVSGMAVHERRNTRAGPAGLAGVPLLGQLFSRHRRQVNRSDLLILVRPRIVRLPPAEVAPSLTFRFGPEQRPLPAL